MCFRLQPPGSPLTDVTAIPPTLPAVPEGVAPLRRAARELAERCGADERLVADVTLAVSEACTNAVVHAYRGRPGTLALTAEAHDGHVRFVVADRGDGLCPRPDSP